MRSRPSRPSTPSALAADRHPARYPDLPHRGADRVDDKEKIALFCNVARAVIEERDKESAFMRSLSASSSTALTTSSSSGSA